MISNVENRQLAANRLIHDKMITKIVIDKFRCFTSRNEFYCDPNATLTTIVGTSGSGKSTILVSIGIATGHLDKENLSEPGAYVELTVNSGSVFFVGKDQNNSNTESYTFMVNNNVVDEAEYHHLLQGLFKVQYVSLNVEDWKTKITDPQALMEFLLSLTNYKGYMDLYREYVSKTTKLHEVTYQTEKHLKNVTKEKIRAQMLHSELKYLRCYTTLSQTLEDLHVKVAVRRKARSLFRVSQLHRLQECWTDRLKKLQENIHESEMELESLNSMCLSYDHFLNLSKSMVSSASNKILSNFANSHALKSKISGKAFSINTLAPLQLGLLKSVITYFRQLSTFLASDKTNLEKIHSNYRSYQNHSKSIAFTASKIKSKISHDLNEARDTAHADRLLHQELQIKLFNLETELNRAMKSQEIDKGIISNFNPWNTDELKVLFPDILGSLGDLIEPEEGCEWCNLSPDEMKSIFQTVSEYPLSCESASDNEELKTTLLVNNKQVAIEYSQRFKDFPCKFVSFQELKICEGDAITNTGNFNADENNLDDAEISKNMKNNIKTSSSEHLSLFANEDDKTESDSSGDDYHSADYSDNSESESENDQNSLFGDETQVEIPEPAYERKAKPELPLYIQNLYPEVCYVSEFAQINDSNEELLVEAALGNCLYVPSAEVAQDIIDQNIFEGDTWMCTRKCEIYFSSKKKMVKYGDDISHLSQLINEMLSLKCQIINVEHDVSASTSLKMELEDFERSLANFEKALDRLDSCVMLSESSILKILSMMGRSETQRGKLIENINGYIDQLELKRDKILSTSSSEKLTALEDELDSLENQLSLDEQDLKDIFKTYHLYWIKCCNTKISESKLVQYIENSKKQISQYELGLQTVSDILVEFDNQLKDSEEFLAHIKGPHPLPDEYKDSLTYFTEMSNYFSIISTLENLPKQTLMSSKVNRICQNQDIMALNESQMQKSLRNEIAQLIEDLVRHDMQVCLILQSLIESVEPHFDKCYQSLHPPDSLQPARAKINLIKSNSCDQGLEIKVCPPSTPFVPLVSLSCSELSRVVISLQLAVFLALGNNVLLVDEVDKYLNQPEFTLLMELLQDISQKTRNLNSHIYLSTSQPATFNASYQYIDTNKGTSCKVAVYSTNKCGKLMLNEFGPNEHETDKHGTSLLESEDNSIFSYLYKGIEDDANS